MTDTNPFSALSFIVAPAVLTNACSVLALGTSNRLARAVDRARNLSNHLEAADKFTPERIAIASKELRSVQSRMLILIRALQAFYFALGSFAGTALLSVLGVVLIDMVSPLFARGMEAISILAGSTAVLSLIYGAFLLVRETKIAVDALEEEAERVQAKLGK